MNQQPSSALTSVHFHQVWDLKLVSLLLLICINILVFPFSDLYCCDVVSKNVSKQQEAAVAACSVSLASLPLQHM